VSDRPKYKLSELLKGLPAPAPPLAPGELEDIIAELRKEGRKLDDGLNALMLMAADELTRLQSENDELKEDAERLHEKSTTRIFWIERENARLQSENERLKALLTKREET
jgi:hypothetical protein